MTTALGIVLIVLGTLASALAGMSFLFMGKGNYITDSTSLVYSSSAFAVLALVGGILLLTVL